jgi:F0F1-type ATP synthase delta subunit
VRRQAAKGLGFVEDDEALQTLIKEASLGDSPIVLECIEALETLGEEEAIRDLFANYSKMPKEVRMRLIIAALNLSSISFADLLKHVLLKESEMDIISEIILGLSHYGEWQIGLLALDRMQNHKLNREQTSKLWMAITKIFCRRVKALHLMSIENREPGSVVFGWKCMTNNTLYDAYLKENIEVFYRETQLLFETYKKWVKGAFVQKHEQEDQVLCLITRISEATRDLGGRDAMLATLVVLNEVEGYVSDRGYKI